MKQEVYICIKAYSVPAMNDMGFLEEENMIEIAEGTQWVRDDDINIIGGEVHLEGEDMQWLEVSKETLSLCFKAKE